MTNLFDGKLYPDAIINAANTLSTYGETVEHTPLGERM
jgi:hypothetical protein